MPPTHLLATPGLRLGPTPQRRSRFVAVERKRVGGGSYRWLSVATLLLAVVGALGYLKVWPPFATVMSASMAPTINTGDVVVLKRLDAPAAIGQIVVVRVPDEARSRYGYPPTVIHRVAKISPDGAVTTKGDAKPEADPFTVPRSAITTRVVTHIPAAGQVFGFLGSTLGLLWLFSGAAMLIATPLLDRYRTSQRRVEEEREEREAVIEQLRVQVELLPAKIEHAVANAVAAIEPARPAAPTRLVAAGAATAPPVPVAPAVPGVVVAPARAGVLATRLVSASQFAAIADTHRAADPAPPAPPTHRPHPVPVPLPEPPVQPNPAPAPPTPPVPPSRFPAGSAAVATGSRFTVARPRTHSLLCAHMGA